MANTVIQFKRSNATATPTNGSLAAAEPAYSFNSDKLFIGNTAGTGVVEVGGKYWVDATAAAFAQANAAYTTANTGTGVSAAFATANLAYAQANTARNQANTATTDAASAFAQANTARTGANTVGGYANSAYGAANLAWAQANTALATGQAAFGLGNAAFAQANTARNLANTALQTAGGTITGDLVVQGNVTFSGTTTYANTQTLLIGDNIFVVNADLPAASAPSENAGIEVNRGSSANTSLIWNEGSDKWTFTNDGSVYYNSPTNTAVETAQTDATNAFAKANTAATDAVNAFAQANTARTGANTVGGYANSAFATANISYAQANTARDHANAAFLKANGAAYLAFGTISAGGTSLVADSNNDTLTITSGNGVVLIADAGTDSFNIALSATGVTATTYGGADTVGRVTVDTWGRITGASNVAIAISAAAITSGTLSVGRGGTGATTFTTNGVLFGQGASAISVTAAGTEGQVLQASAAGVPSFGMLDGGTF